MFPYNVQFICNKKNNYHYQAKKRLISLIQLVWHHYCWSVDAIFLSKLPQIGNNINSREPFTSYIIYFKTAKQQGQACLITEQWFTELFQY